MANRSYATTFKPLQPRAAGSIWGAVRARCCSSRRWSSRSSLALTMLSQMGIAIIVCLSLQHAAGAGRHAQLRPRGVFGPGRVHRHPRDEPGGQGQLPLPLVPDPAGRRPRRACSSPSLFGYVTTKKAGTTFAMITLGIGELVLRMALMFPSFFGGEGGVTTNRVFGTPFLGITFGPQIQVYYLIAVYCFICTALMFAFTRTPLGRMLNAVRDNPERVEFIGYDTQRVRYLAFIIAGFFAGIARRPGGDQLRDRHAPRAVSGAALGRLPAVHLPGRRDLLLRADHRRRAAGAGLGAAVGAHQGLAAVPGPGVPVHGDVRAGRHRQPDHDEPAGGRVRQAASRCWALLCWRWSSPALLAGRGRGGDGRDGLSPAAQRGARAGAAVRRR